MIAKGPSFTGPGRPAEGLKIGGPRTISSEDIRIFDVEFAEWASPRARSWKGSVSAMSREEVDAKLERTEARVSATLAEMRADFSGMRADMSSFREQIAVKLSEAPSKTFIVGTAIAIVAALVAVLGVGAAMYGNGIMVATSSVDRANQALAVSEQNQSQIQTLTQDIGAVLEEVRALRQQPVQSEE